MPFEATSAAACGGVTAEAADLLSGGFNDSGAPVEGGTVTFAPLGCLAGTPGAKSL
jgi:hypothetical protein